MEHEIYNQDSGFKKVLKELIENDINFKVKTRNKSRHKHIISDIGSFYLLYKREYFNTFGKQFKSTEFTSGESINKDALLYCFRNKVKLLIFIHKTEVKCVSPEFFYKIALKNKWIRRQERSNLYSEGIIHEKTYSIPKEYLVDYKLKLLY